MRVGSTFSSPQQLTSGVVQGSVLGPLLFRPPGTISSGRASVLPVTFSFFRHAFCDIPRPIALKLCHMIGIWLYFIN